MRWKREVLGWRRAGTLLQPEACLAKTTFVRWKKLPATDFHPESAVRKKCSLYIRRQPRLLPALQCFSWQWQWRNGCKWWKGDGFSSRRPKKNCKVAHAESSIRSSDLVEKESWPIQVSESQFTSVFQCTLPLNTKFNAPLNFCLNEPDWPVARLNCCILHQILLQS